MFLVFFWTKNEKKKTALILACNAKKVIGDLKCTDVLDVDGVLKLNFLKNVLVFYLSFQSCNGVQYHTSFFS